MYPKASPFSLALAMLVQDQVLSLLSELTFLQKKKDQNQDEATASSCLMLATALVFKKFFKTERAVLLNYHIWLKDKRRSSVLFSVRLASGIKRVWMGLSDN